MTGAQDRGDDVGESAGGAGNVVAQAPTFKRTVLQQADISVPGHEVISALAEFQPGASPGRHTHPGEEIGYVIEGTVALEQQGASVLDQVVQIRAARVDAYASDDTEYEIAIIVPDSGPLDVQFTASSDSQEKAERCAEQVKKGFAQALTSVR